MSYKILLDLRNATWLYDYFIWYMDLNHGQYNLLKISQVEFVKQIWTYPSTTN